MRVIVLGGGVIGITTAYELAKDGHEVIVLEKNAALAQGASHANAGLIAPGHAYAWGSPASLRTVVKSIIGGGGTFRFRPGWDLNFCSWSLRFLRNCTTERFLSNTRAKARFSMYSRERLGAIVEQTQIEYDRNQGLLYVFRDSGAMDRAIIKAEVLVAEGLELQPLDARAAITRDPGLAPAAHKIAGAIFAPSDESGDAQRFTAELARYLAEKHQVQIKLGTAIRGFHTKADKITAVETSRRRETADHFVFCLGPQSRTLARQLGIALPIYPIKGYSATLPLSAQHRPRMGGADEDNAIAYCPMGERLRVTSIAEFAGEDVSFTASDFTHMLRCIEDLFPLAADYNRAIHWSGLRPMTPSGLPIIRQSRFHNLILNVGHGHLGWTMAAGSARLAADLVRGLPPAFHF